MGLTRRIVGLFVGVLWAAGLGLDGCGADGVVASTAVTEPPPEPAVVQGSSVAASEGQWTSVQITHNWTKNQRPHLDGNRLVWQAYDGLDWEILDCDLATGVVTQLTDDAADETDPLLDGDRLVWISRASAATSASGNVLVADPVITLHDLRTGATTKVPGSDGVRDATLEGDLIAWRSGDGTGAEVFFCDLATGGTKRLTEDDRRQGHPQTDGRLVAFTTDAGDGRAEVFVYDTLNATMRRLSSPAASVTATYPQVNAGRVAWLETDGTHWSVLMWNAATGTTQDLARSDKRLSALGLGGSTVAWLRWNSDRPTPMPHESPWAMVLYDLTTGSERQVADSADGRLWLEPDGGLLVYTQFVFGGGSRFRVYDPAGGMDEMLDPDPEQLSVGGPEDQQLGGRGTLVWGDSTAGVPDYWVGPILNEGRVVFGAYQSVNAVYDDSDIILAYRGTPPATTVSPCPPARRFADIDASPYRAAIERLAARGIVRGKAIDGRLLFSPSAPVLRWQFLRMALEATGVRYPFYTEQPEFVDLIGPGGEDLMLRSVVAGGLACGITKGTSASHFDPYAPISRAQAITMAVRAAEALRAGSTATPDSFEGSRAPSSAAHADSLRRAEYHHLLDGLAGVGPGWDAQAVMTREEAAQLLLNLLDLEV